MRIRTTISNGSATSIKILLIGFYKSEMDKDLNENGADNIFIPPNLLIQ